MASTTIKTWLADATDKLSEADISSARLDAHLLLQDVLGKDAMWLRAHDDSKITPRHLEELNDYIERRQNREPLAYIRGFVEFYGRKYIVSPETLIPRPETETLVQKAVELPLQPSSRAIDVGTGSGCIGISIKLARPDILMLQSDISERALEIAERNASRLGAHSTFILSDLLTGYTGDKFDLIVANLPYVDAAWETSPEVDAEPSLAIYAQDGGLQLIKELLDQAPAHLQRGGYVLLEADPRQFDAIWSYAQKGGYAVLGTDGYTISLQRS